MIDHRERQTQSARRERRELLRKDKTLEQFRILAQQGKIPAGSVWHWATGNIFGPIGSAKEKANAA